MTTHRPHDLLAFVVVVLIWSTTPLAIVVSNAELDPYLSLLLRMLISLLFLGLWYGWQRRPLPFHAQAWPTHLSVGLVGIGMSMTLVYQAAQQLPSSWIALMFGLAPVFTGILEGLVFRGLRLGVWQWLGIGLAFGGLWRIFHDPEHSLNGWSWPVLAMLLATFLHSLSASLVKRVTTPLPVMDTVMGGLMLAAPMVLVLWLLQGAQLPENWSWATLGAIAYLGLFGSLAGFLLYYQVLRAFSATMSSFITLLAPPLALVWGSLLNDEPLTWPLLTGAGMILAGLALFVLPAADKRA